MANIFRSAIIAGILLFVGCSDPDALPSQRDVTTEEPEPAEPVPTPVVRTGDPVKRGLTEEDFPRIQELAEGVYSYEALRSAGEERFTTVSLFVVTPDGVLVADGQGNESETARMLEQIRRVTDQPVTHLVVCSDHGDHTGGNAAFPPGVRVFAHPTSAAVLTARASASERIGGPTGLVATDLVQDATTIRLGGRTIEVRFLGRAHTGGDLVVHVPDAGVLFMSEAYLNRIFPAMRTAYPSEWVAMIERAQAINAPINVPGHGFVESSEILAEELETFRLAIEQVISEGRRLHSLGLTVEAAVEQADFGDLEGWSLRSSQGPTAIRRIFLELDGQLR